MKLLEIIESLQVTRTLIHSIVYLFEQKYGIEIGYRDCKWKNTAHGLYCEEIERDLEVLEKKGLIRISSEGLIVSRRNGYSEKLSQDEAYSVLKEALRYYTMNISRGIDY